MRSLTPWLRSVDRATPEMVRVLSAYCRHSLVGEEAISIMRKDFA